MIPALATAPVMSLRPEEVESWVDALHAYHAIYSPLFPRREQRQWSADSLRGLLLDLRRTAIAPMIWVLHGADGKAIRALQQFVSAGAGPDRRLLKRPGRAVEGTRGDADGGLTLDGSALLKQGTEAVGGQRQYCGAVGKRATCHAGVLLGYASQGGYPLWDRRLYLPLAWGEGEDFAARRKTWGVPSDVHFRTPPARGWEMSRAGGDDQQLRARWVPCEAAFGRDPAFLDHGAGSGLWYCAEVPHDPRGWLERPRRAGPGGSGRGRTPSRERLCDGQHDAEGGASRAARVHPAQWPRRLIQEGSKGPMVADLWALRVVAVRDALPGPAVWVVLRRQRETGALQPYVCNALAAPSLATLARLSGMRWPSETCCEDSKQYLGMGEYEVRSWRGWHHHMTRCLLAHFFLVRQPQVLTR